MPHVQPPRYLASDKDLPTGGRYPVLTLQINVTWSAVSDGLKHTMAIREPNDKQELARYVSPLQVYATGFEVFQSDLALALVDLNSLRRTQS